MILYVTVHKKLTGNKEVCMNMNETIRLSITGQQKWPGRHSSTRGCQRRPQQSHGHSLTDHLNVRASDRAGKERCQSRRYEKSSRQGPIVHPQPGSYPELEECEQDDRADALEHFSGRIRQRPGQVPMLMFPRRSIVHQFQGGEIEATPIPTFQYGNSRTECHQADLAHVRDDLMRKERFNHGDEQQRNARAVGHEA